MKKPKILIASPVSNKKEYCLWEWLSLVNSLSYLNYELALCDNSIDANFHKKLIPYCDKVFHINPTMYENFWQVQTESLLVLRDYFLNGDYDYFFSLECDIFPKFDVIESLLLDKIEYGKRCNVIGYPYILDVKSNSRVMMMEQDTFGFASHAQRIFDYESGFIKFDGDIEPTYHLGLGCILFSKKVIEKVFFRYSPFIDNPPDFFIHEDLYSLGEPVIISKRYMPRHYNSNWGTMVF